MRHLRFVLLSVILINIMILALHAPQPVSAQVTIRYAIPSGGLTTGSCNSWTDACTLTRAIEAAAAGDEIWVKTGTYTPGTLRSNYFTLKNGVAMYGGFAGTESSRADRNWITNVTTLSGDIGTIGSIVDNSYHVIDASELNSSTVLDGFTITRGNANGGLGKPNNGAGMYLASSSPTLANLIFAGNTASANGGGIYLTNSSPTLTHVIFVGNVASYGAGISNFASNPILTNATFAGNTSNNGILYSSSNSSPQVRNSIFWSNAGSSIRYNSTGTAIVRYSDVRNGFPGVGNIDSEPWFVDPPSPGPDTYWGTADDNYGDLRLRAMSPAINRGDNNITDPALPAVDMAGQPRMIEDTVDMGAYENQLPNHAPVLSGVFPSLWMNQDPDPIDIPETTVGTLLSGHVSDVDGNAENAGMVVYGAESSYGTWQYSLDEGANWLTMVDLNEYSVIVLAPNARLRFVPNAGWNGRANLTFRAWDRSGQQPSGPEGINVSVNGLATAFSAQSGTLSAFVTSGPNAPVIHPILDKTIDELTPLTFTVTASSPLDPPPTLSYSLDDGAPDGASIDPVTGVFTWTPSEVQGPQVYSIAVRVTDNNLPPASSSAFVQVTVGEVNTEPYLHAIGSKNVNEGSLLFFTASSYDGDFPTNTFRYSLDPGAPAGASINATSGTFNWTPSEGQGPDTYTITVRVTDSGIPEMSDSETIQVTVGETNMAPVLSSIDDKIIDENALLSFFAAATDSDLPANSFTYSLASGAPEGASIDPTTGEFRWTPSEAQGPQGYSITVIVNDNGIPVKSDSRTFQVSVVEVNAAPVLEMVADQSVDEGGEVSITLAAADPLDIPSNSLSYSVSGLPQGASYQMNSQTGAFTWTPAEADGPDSHILTFTVTDNGYPAASHSRAVLVTVDEVNTAPVLTPIGAKTVDEETLLSFTAITTDTDLPKNTIRYSLEPGAPDGAAIDPVTGTFSWTPSEAHGRADGTGVYTITIYVNDGVLPPLSDSETITVTVNDVNVAPEALPNQYRVSQGVQLSVSAAGGVLANDSDHESSPLTAILVDSPDHGSLTLYEDGGFEYTADINYYGESDTFTYQASDGLALSNIATVTFMINVPPVVNLGADQVINEGETASFTALITDEDSPPPSWIVDWDFADGTTWSGGTTTSRLYPNNGTFLVTAATTDMDGAPGKDSLQLTVNNVAPQINPTGAIQVMVGESFNLAMSFTDPGVQDTHDVEITWQPGQTETINDLKADVLNFSTTHTYNMFGTFNVLVSVSDKDGGTGTYTVPVTVIAYRVMLPSIIR